MKNSIRREIKKTLLALSDNEKEEANNTIYAKLTNSLCFQNAKSIFVYYSTELEVNTREIIKLALNSNKTVAIPKLVDNMQTLNKQPDDILDETIDKQAVDNQFITIDMGKTIYKQTVRLDKQDNHKQIIKTDMRAVKIDRDSSLVKNKFGIFEPVDNDEIENIDLCITPLVAFDRNKTRLGHGKGYYDRFLEEHNCFKVALAFSCQEVNLIPKDENDIDMDMIITEKEIIK